jgi:hypothetical protein
MAARGTFFFSAAVAAVFLAISPAAVAEDAAPSAPKDQSADACAHFAWPITRERAWLSEKMPPTPSGMRVVKKDQSYQFDLALEKKTEFFLAPERKPKADTYSGDVTIAGVPTPGLYQITLSGEAWIDVFENGTRLKSSAFSGVENCPGVRKSVRFDLAPGAAVTIQISNSAKNSIKLAIAPAS